jgi:hypothetical protein
LKGIAQQIRTLSILNYSTFLKRAAAIGAHRRAAELLGVSPATESEYTTEHLERVCQVLAAYGLEVVVKGSTIPPEQAKALMTLAAAHMERAAIEMQAQDTTPGALGD